MTKANLAPARIIAVSDYPMDARGRGRRSTWGGSAVRSGFFVRGLLVSVVLLAARRGYPADQAQDQTQDFFMRVLEGRYLDRADPEKGAGSDRFY